MQTIDLNEASKKLSNLVELLLQGEEIIIIKDNQLVVKLMPLLPVKQTRQPGSTKGLVTISDDFEKPIADFEDYQC